MFKSVVPISLKKHGKKRIKTLQNFDFAKEANMASIMVHEFSRAASIYPIVFMEDKRNNQFRPVVLLGLEQGENLFIQKDRWQASYVPAIIRRYPFALAKTGEEGRFTICIDEQSELLNDEEGQPLFEDNGEPAELMNRVKRYLSDLQKMDLFTDAFCKYLAEKNLFAPLNMKIRIGKEMRNIKGAYVVNEERINALSDEVFIEMRTRKYIPVVYSHLSSLSQIERLINFKDKKSISVKELGDQFSEPPAEETAVVGKTASKPAKHAKK